MEEKRQTFYKDMCQSLENSFQKTAPQTPVPELGHIILDTIQGVYARASFLNPSGNPVGLPADGPPFAPWDSAEKTPTMLALNQAAALFLQDFTRLYQNFLQNLYKKLNAQRTKEAFSEEFWLSLKKLFVEELSHSVHRFHSRVEEILFEKDPPPKKEQKAC